MTKAGTGIASSSSSLSSMPSHSSSGNLTGREIQVFLKDSKIVWGLQEDKPQPRSPTRLQDVSLKLHTSTTSPPRINKRTSFASLHRRSWTSNDDDTLKPQNSNCYEFHRRSANHIAPILEENDDLQHSKTLTCVLLMDVVFEAVDFQDLPAQFRKSELLEYSKIYMLDTNATRDLLKESKSKLEQLKADQIYNVLQDNNSLTSKRVHLPPPLPAKPNNLPKREQFQTFPIQRACSLEEHINKLSCPPPLPPNRNKIQTPGRSEGDILLPVPPVRTTSMGKQETIRKIDMQLPSALVKAVQEVIDAADSPTSSKINNCNGCSSKSLSLNFDDTFVQSYQDCYESLDEFNEKGGSNVQDFNNKVRAFDMDDVPYVDDPDSLDYPVELCDDNLSMADSDLPQESSTVLCVDDSRRHAFDQFNTLADISSKAKSYSDQTISKTYELRKDLELSFVEKTARRELDLCASGSDEEVLNHYERINYSPAGAGHAQTEGSSGKVEKTEKKILHKNDLVIVESKFFANKLSHFGNSTGSGDDDDASSSHQGKSPTKSDETESNKEEELVLAYDRGGNVYYISRNVLKDYCDPNGESWYYPVPLTMLQSSSFLKDAEQFGTFLIYRSPRSKQRYYMSVRVPDDVVHYCILTDAAGSFYIVGDCRQFPSLKDLVNFYKRNKGGLVARLKRPLKEANMSLTPGYHYDLKYELKRKEVKFSGKILGFGHFGTICVGDYRKKSVVVEVLESLAENDDISAARDKEDGFIEVACLLMELCHPNVIEFVGLCCQKAPCYFLTEYSEHGNLKNFLKQDSISPNDTESLVDFCFQMSSALSYLANRSFVIHRNVSCRSFLVFNGMKVKLTDFHRARFVYEDLYSSSPSDQIYVKWAAPEVLLDQTYTTKSDVWALAIAMWEVFSMGDSPFSGMTVDAAAENIVRGNVPCRPNASPKPIYDLMQQCWKSCPLDRPQARKITNSLAAWRVRSVNEPRDLNSAEYLMIARSQIDLNQPNDVNITTNTSTSTSSNQIRTKKFFSPKHKEAVDKPFKTESLISLAPSVNGEIAVPMLMSGKRKESGQGARMRHSMAKLFGRASLTDLTLRSKNFEGSKSAKKSTQSKSFQTDSINIDLKNVHLNNSSTNL